MIAEIYPTNARSGAPHAGCQAQSAGVRQNAGSNPEDQADEQLPEEEIEGLANTYNLNLVTAKKHAFGIPLKRRLEEGRSQEEAFALEIFLSAYGKPYSAPQRGIPGEDPDFLVEVDGERVGLELTELVSSELRKQEEFRVDVIVEARDAYGDSGGPPLEVNVQWHDLAVRGDRKKIAEGIVGVIDSMAPANLPVHVRHEVP